MRAWLRTASAVAIVLCVIGVWAACTRPRRAIAANASDVSVDTTATDLKNARELLKQGKPEEASVFALRAVLSTQASLEAVGLYVKAKMAQADAAWCRNDHVEALEACGLAVGTVRQAWQNLVKAVRASTDDARELTKLKTEATAVLLQHL